MRTRRCRLSAPKRASSLNADVRQKMKTIFTTLALLGLLANSTQAQEEARLTSDQMRSLHERMFTDVQDCALASESYQKVHIGSPLADVIALKDTPLPSGLYWPNFTQKDGSIITMQGTTPPPDDWGTNYITRIDGLSSKQFCFFHDGSNVVRIAYAILKLTSTPPVPPNNIDVPYEPKGPWIMEENQ